MALREFVSNNLQDPVGLFQLNSAGQGRLNDDRKLIDCGLAPSALVYFVWEQETLAQFGNANMPVSFLRRELEQRAEPIPQ